MDIIVCIKQVPSVSEVRVDPETKNLVRDGIPCVINPYDLHAIEAAIQIREQVGGRVTVITMGPPQAEDSLREAISMGADDVRLISDRAFAGADTLATSYTLARAIEKLGYEIIICGKQAVDGDTGQVGPELAEFLNIPHIAYVKKIEDITGESIRVQRAMDDGYDIVQTRLPVLLTVGKDLNSPRFPSLKGKMAAKKAVIARMGLEDLGIEKKDAGLEGSPTKVKDVFSPERKKEKRMLQGSVEEQVETVIQELKRLQCL